MPTDFGQQNKTKELLTQIGLTDTEQEAYLYGISRPPLSVSILAKQLGFTRSNMYNVITSLQDKGLCWSLGGEYKRKIQFAKPEMLGELCNRRIKEAQSLSKEVSVLAKNLEDQAYSGAISQPKIQYFEGKEAVRKLYSSSLSTQEGSIRTAVSDKLFEQIGEDYVQEYVDSRLSMGIKNKILYAESLENFKYTYKPDPRGNREVRRPPENIKFDSMMLIFDTKVAIITLANETFGTLIESVDYSNTMKSWFDAIWEMSDEGSE